MNSRARSGSRNNRRQLTWERRRYHEARFWARVSMSGDSSACWEFQGPKDGSGHGNYYIGKRHFGTRSAHRIAFLLANGCQPAQLMVRHLCANPLCCNPAHLVLGTQLENMHDRFVLHGDKRGPHPVADPAPEPPGGWRIVTGDLPELDQAAEEAEFWQNVERSSDELSCWPWIGDAWHEFGYGAWYWEGRHTSAHRVAYILHHELTLEALGGDVVRHLCPNRSNPACCNPSHLGRGSQLENMQDRAREGKYTHGDSHFATKLSDADLVKLREEYWLTEPSRKPTLKQLAARYGLTDSRHVHRLVHGDLRVEAGGPVADPDPQHRTQHARGERHPLVRHSDALIKALREEYAATPEHLRPSTIALGKRYGTDSKTIWNWLHGKARKSAGGPICA
jgi:HNH endonuclease